MEARKRRNPGAADPHFASLHAGYAYTTTVSRLAARVTPV
jgi:hypothetical protein